MIIGCCKDESTLFSMNDPVLFQLNHRSLQERVLKAGSPIARRTTCLPIIEGITRKIHLRISGFDSRQIAAHDVTR